MKKPKEVVRLICVRIAESSGWLFNIRADIIHSYLSSARVTTRTSPESHSVFNFPRLSFGILAAGAFASIWIIASFPSLGIEPILRSREQQAAAQYKELIDLQTAAERRADALTPESRETLMQGRIQLSGLLFELESLRSADSEEHGGDLPNTALKLRSISRALRVTDSGQAIAAPVANVNIQRAFAVTSTYAGRVESVLNTARTQLESLPPVRYAYSSQHGRRSIKRDQILSRTSDFPELATQEAETRLPTRYKDWDGFVAENGSPYDPAEVLRGDSMRSIAGGIILGSTSTPDQQRDLSTFVLTYDIKNQRLALVGPKSEIYYSGPVEPQTLRALNAFVLKDQTIAVSVGWSGKHELTAEFTGSTVLLDPAFADTKAGQYLVRADSLPWEFYREYISGWHNPIAAQFAVAWEMLNGDTSTDLARYLQQHPPDQTRLAALLDEVTADQHAYKEKLAACSMEPEFIELLVKILQRNYGLSRGSALQAIDQQVLRRTTLATLYDKTPSFSLNSGRLELRSRLEYRYVTSRVELGNPIKFGVCLGGSDVRHLDSLDHIVNTHVDDIATAFPAVQNVQEYASIAAFLRWARQPGHLQAVDFYSLLSIPPHNDTLTPTPDLIHR